MSEVPIGFADEDELNELAEQAQLLLEQFDREMSVHDLDSAQMDEPDAGRGEHRLASIGIYYYESSDQDQDLVEE